MKRRYKIIIGIIAIILVFGMLSDDDSTKKATEEKLDEVKDIKDLPTKEEIGDSKIEPPVEEPTQEPIEEPIAEPVEEEIIPEKEVISVLRDPNCDIVFTSDLHEVGIGEQGSELYCINDDGKNLRRITNNNYFEFHADVSPTRNEILTVTLFDGGFDNGHELDPEAELVIWDFEGNIVQRLTNNARPESVPHWSPDGETITFFAGDKIGELNVYTISRDGTNEKQVSSGGVDVDPSFTPEGEIIFSRGHEVIIVDSDGTNERSLFKLDIEPEDPISLDSDTIMFEALTKSTSANWGIGDYDVYFINRDGTNLRDLSNSDFADALPQPMKDRIVFWRITDEPGTKIMTMNTDGTNVISLISEVSNTQMATGNM